MYKILFISHVFKNVVKCLRNTFNSLQQVPVPVVIRILCASFLPPPLTPTGVLRGGVVRHLLHTPPLHLRR